MIKYKLVCNSGHEFEGWFQSSAGYEEQIKLGLISCPHCGSLEVARAIMAPAITTSGRKSDGDIQSRPGRLTQDEMRQLMRKMRREIETRAEYVGPRFAEEARKIHGSETPERGIYGEASVDEAKALAEDGIPFLPVPRLPEDLN